MTYPPAPWHLRGDMYVSVWRLGRRLVGTAFVDYGPGGVLRYHELLSARLTAPSGAWPAVTVTEIWVDSEPSLRGGRELWAIPKQRADFSFAAGECTAAGLAAATFVGSRRLPGRLPFRLCTAQRREDGTQVIAPVRGDAHVRLARADWDIDPTGALSYLRGRRPIASVVLTDFRLAFG